MYGQKFDRVKIDIFPGPFPARLNSGAGVSRFRGSGFRGFRGREFRANFGPGFRVSGFRVSRLISGPR